MLGIITSFRSQGLAREWDYHVWLLQRTLDSILSQTNDSFIVIVVCHEMPSVSQTGHSKVQFLSVDFSPPKRDNDDMCADKVLKLSMGAEWALTRGCKYLMFVDADDLLNRNVSEYVATYTGKRGWYTASEFVYAYGSRWILTRHLAPMTSGPSVILRSDLMEFASPPFSGHWLRMIIEGGEGRYAELLASRNRRVSTIAAVGHIGFPSLMSAEGNALEPLPFICDVVINHSDSTSQVPGGRGSVLNKPATRLTLRNHLGRLKRYGMTLPSLRLLTRSLREEFSIPAPHEIPGAYRNRGSIFSRDIDAEVWLGRS